MRHLIIILIICSCGTNDKKGQLATQTESFQLFIKNLRKLEKGYTYNLVQQDAEGCYIPNKNVDSLFYNSPFPILGILQNNNSIFSIIHLEPGEDFHPTLRTFTIEGELIDEEFIDYSYCSGGRDCNFVDCSEIMTIVSKDTIEDVVKLVTAPCDDLGNKITGPSKTEVKRRMITIENNGQINVIEKKG